ncbi:MAG: branched-chain amino acid ABC transporter substrate-binding protein [Collimonas sp.]|uniref:branched-chain amino acid ABC transporter substrate-binding protein n=1 Tax=Collimonas sp. TaxID=1963772 RepID=UPI003264A47C
MLHRTRFTVSAALAFTLAGALAPSSASVSMPANLAPIRLGMIEGTSGPFANAGEAVEHNIRFAVEQVNARGGVRLPDGRHSLSLTVFDSKQGVEDALLQLKQLTDQKIPFVLEGNSSAVAGALVEAINKHNARTPGNRVLFMNYSAVDPALTNEKCSFWHFRFDANADMRMRALVEVIKNDRQAKSVYLIGQDYSFGQQVAKAARQQLQAARPDIKIVGDELHPIGKVKDFAPYIAKIRASGADTVITGNWGNDLTLLVKAAKEAGLHLKFYTFYANSLGAPAAIGDAGVGTVRAVAEWHPNVADGVQDAASDAFYRGFRQRFPQPKDDYLFLRMDVMIDMLAAAIEKAQTTDAIAVARALEGAQYKSQFHQAGMRASDHQLIQPLYVAVMQKLADGGIRFDNEGSGYGFKTERYLAPEATALPTTCKMQRP